MIQELQRT